jgi:hypothetical protein
VEVLLRIQDALVLLEVFVVFVQVRRFRLRVVLGAAQQQKVKK